MSNCFGSCRIARPSSDVRVWCGYPFNPMIAMGRSNRLLNDVAELPQADYNGSKKQSKQLSY